MLLVQHENNIAFLSLNRPDKYNSFNREMALGLQAELDRCAKDETIRAIYIRGVGKAFSAGQDLGEATDPEGPELRSIVRDHYNPIIERIRTIEKPVVAAVNGVAAGAGANIALACDVVVASESACFLQAFSKIGLIPDSGGTFFLPRLIGFQKASALMMLGDKVTASDAERMGMIYKVFADEVFEKESKQIAQKLAQLPTRALVYTKLALNESLGNSLQGQLATEEEFQYKSGKTADFREGVAAFIEKRKAVFSGR
jgi:2-(1,2-epoxy-1,2-dihydrophenyl)acetyl-CoA isomerase